MKKAGKIILFVILGIIVLSTFIFLWNKSRPEVTVYEIVSPVTGTVENKTVATGKVEPRDEILIKPQISGIVSEVFKEAGQRIQIGEVIASVKVIPEMGALNSAESRVKVAEINLQQIETEYARQTQLHKKGVISKEEFDAAESSYKKAKEEKSNASDALDIVRNGVSKRYARLSNTQIRSTISGMILDIPIKAGNSVIQANTFNDGTTIALVANMNDLIFRGNIDETEVGRVKEGMPITLTIGALSNNTFDAVLEYISPKGAEQNGAVLFEMKAAVKVPDSVFIRAGYSANAEIVLARATDVLTIPESALEFSNDSAFVYIVKAEKPQQEFEKKQVFAGLSDGVNIEIKKGLTLTDKIRGNAIDLKAKITPKKP
ncbi:MAG: Macrolide export protein MacA [Candidatus Ordinivivax streblomastigis]|uniref:Macrolide export protein MacA n=1 Tax=Candidatus Ordinivivax streblomastigis TaxID=2540710 RepID=A0A5M8P4T7_9BACT|nr:MAG: Macrolide export protein MacA [Candidatus Ordinivivax streblomastigis]